MTEGRTFEAGQKLDFWVFKLRVSTDLQRIKFAGALFFYNVKNDNMVTVIDFSLVVVRWRLYLVMLAGCFILNLSEYSS
jgi:hypothetical protein